MLKILIYDDLGNLELEGETVTGQVGIDHRMSYLDWLTLEDVIDPQEKQNKYVTSPMATYLDIRWDKQLPAPVSRDTYSSLEEGVASINPRAIDWTGKVIRLEASDVLNQKRQIHFYNIVFEPEHPKFEMNNEIVEEVRSGYPSFSITREIRMPGEQTVLECTDFRIRIKATRSVQFDCDRYEELHGPIPKKLPEEFVSYLFP